MFVGPQSMFRPRVLTPYKNKTKCVCLTRWTFLTLGAVSSRSFFIAVMGVSLKYGGSPSTISTTMIPRDQMST